MDILNVQQSELLNQIAKAPLSYDSLSVDEKKICNFLTEMGFINYQSTLEGGDFSNDVTQLYEKIISFSITEKGKMYLKNERLKEAEILQMEEQVNSLRLIADSAKKQAELATKNAEIAKEDAKRARRDAIFSKIIAVIAVVISVADMISNYICG